MKIPKRPVFVNKIGVLPAPMYNPHPGILYVKSVYNPRVIHRKLRYIIYWDANNLYGWVMSQCLPTGGFHWVSDEELATLDVRDIADDADKGYILEVDLEYPDSLHDVHNDYPLAPERRTIDKKQLSPYSQQLIDELRTERQAN